VNSPTAARPLLVRLTFQAHTYDIDFAGIVSNIVYIRWLEDLRGHMLAGVYPVERMQSTGVGPVLLGTDIHYLRALKLGDRPVGEMWVAEARAARWILQAEFTLEGVRVCEARQTGAFVHYARMRPVPVPEELRRALEAAGGG
jgi:acyl-CoA thioester hydrolase